MAKEKKLYEAFCVYIEACRKLNQILWDSVASSELLEPDKKHRHFIRSFESKNEFNNLIKAIEAWDSKKPKEENEYFEYYHRIIGCLQRFFINTGIYDKIISGRQVNKDKAFYIFLGELEKKNIEVLKYGEVFPLKIEMKTDQILEFGDFILLTDLSKYNINYETKFVFLLQNFVWPQHLGIPHIILGENEIAISGETPFSVPLFIFNLYFEKPVYIPEWYETHPSLLSFWYQPKHNSLKYTKSVKDKFYSDLCEKYFEEACDASWVDEENRGYIDWNKHREFINEKEEEFINSGKAPINYVKEAEVAKFKEFIAKTRDFLGCDLYKNQKYLQIATHYYLMLHERSDIANNLVNYVVALESLYFAEESFEMKERLANRTANLLGKTFEDKAKIREMLLWIYKLRCKYVHGKSKNTELDKIIGEKFSSKDEFSNWLRNILRASLLSFFRLSKYYDSNKKREELLESLDSVFEPSLIENIQIQASDFLFLAIPYDFYIR